MDTLLRFGQLLELEKVVWAGHNVRPERADLGLGWLYYGLLRSWNVRHVVVIGSLRGFVPIVAGLAVRDNGNGGRVWFVDPGYVDDFWHDPKRVAAHFERFGVASQVVHVRAESTVFAREFAQELDCLFVDGLHTAEQARLDHEAFAQQLGTRPALFHDSLSRVYAPNGGRPYTHTTWQYIDALRADPRFVVADLCTIGQGLTLVQRRLQGAEAPSRH